MQKLSKFVLFLFILFITLFSYFSYITTSVSADLEPPAGKVEDPKPFPKIKYPCDADGEDPEFHSLRPYQAAPCGGAALAKFCSNDLVFTETFDLAGEGNCQKAGYSHVFTCNPQVHVGEHDLYIELSGSELPILGNTEQVTNSRGGTEEFDDAQKVNEYASWYLSGVSNRAEYGIPTDNQVVDLSGPLNKLLPQMIQEWERAKTIDKTQIEKEFIDETGTGDDGKTVDTIKEVENHDQIVVCGDVFKFLGIEIGQVKPTNCYGGNQKIRLSEWLGDLSDFNGFFNNLLRTNAWNKRTPPFPWDDGTVTDPEQPKKPFESQKDYAKAYREWRGDFCVRISGLNINLCVDNPFVPNKWAKLYPYIPLSSTADKKGSNYIKGDGPTYDASGQTIIDNAQHKSYSGAPLYFAHSQEVKELSELLNTTFKPQGFEGISYTERDDVEKILKEKLFINGQTVDGDECSLLNVRVNQGDNLFAGDKGGEYEMWVKGVQYDIIQVECTEIKEYPPPGTLCGNPPGPCKPIHTLKCPAEIKIEIMTGTKTPNANEIFNETVAGTGSTFRKIFPKVGEGAPVECLADIPTSTDVYYDPTKSDTPSANGKPGNIFFKVQDKPEDGSASVNQLTFPHIGSVYEYFLKGIQTALRPKGYGEPIASGNCETEETPEVGQCKQWLLDEDVYNKVIAAAASTKCNGKSLNPFWAIGIGLNENGGLMTDDLKGLSKSHFGCNISQLQTIEDKISCMTNTLRNDCLAGKTDEATLQEYGYLPGYELWPITVLDPGGVYPPPLFGSGFNTSQLITNLNNTDWRAAYAPQAPTFCPSSPTLPY